MWINIFRFNSSSGYDKDKKYLLKTNNKGQIIRRFISDIQQDQPKTLQ